MSLHIVQLPSNTATGLLYMLHRYTPLENRTR